MSSRVLDASALLALLNQEPGKDRVEEVLADSIVGAVNYCEALGELIDAGVPDDEARHSIDLTATQLIKSETCLIAPLTNEPLSKDCRVQV